MICMGEMVHGVDRGRNTLASLIFIITATKGQGI